MRQVARHEDAADRRQARTAPQATAAGPITAPWLLRLQRAAGNAATSLALQRAPDAATSRKRAAVHGVGTGPTVQRGLGDAPPVLERRSHTVHLRLPGHPEPVEVPCERQTDGSWVARLPVRTDASDEAAHALADTLGVTSADIRLVPPPPALRLPMTQVIVPAELVVTGQRVAIRCNRTEGGQWTALLPSGVDPEAVHDRVADVLGVEPAQIRFTNVPRDEVSSPVGARRLLGSAEKVTLARFLVARFAGALGITVDDRSAVAFLAERTVEILAPEPWAARVRAQFNASTTAESIEGITSVGARADRQVWINGANHTLPAIAHELFHTLEHDRTHDLAPLLVEAVTEYFTARATGVVHRCARDGGGVYTDPLGFLRRALTMGVVTEQDLVGAYFHGEVSLLEPLQAAFFRHDQQQDEERARKRKGGGPEKEQVTKRPDRGS